MPAPDSSSTDSTVPALITARESAAVPGEDDLLMRQGVLSGPRTHGAAIAINVPATYTSFVGRVTEFAAIANLLHQPSVRLVTLTGPGGVGKTRIATHLAFDPGILDDFPGGIVFVELAGIDRTGSILATIAITLGMPSGPETLLRQKLAHSFARRRTLLILDNLEHLANCAPVVTALLQASDDLVILATSRVPLGISAEHEYPLPPFAVATGSDPTSSDAFRLFTDRAQTADPAFRLDDHVAPLIAEICAQVDGLPLAIELMAAQVRFLPPEALLSRLTHRLTLLANGPRDAPLRHQTMRDNIAWSYDLLSPVDRDVFRRMAVFTDGFTLDAVEAVLDASTASPVLAAVRRLFDQNLLQRVSRSNDTPRYRMLETIREYGLERLADEDDLPRWQSAHASYFLDLAEATSDPMSIVKGTNPTRQGPDLANLNAALGWFETNGDGKRLIRLAVALRRLWVESQYQEQGIFWLRRALSMEGRRPSLAAAKAQVALGTLLMFRDLEHSREHLLAGIAHLRDLSAFEELALALIRLGVNASFGNDLDRARQLIQEAGEVATHSANPDFAALLAADVESNLSVIARERGDVLEATRHAESALASATRHGQVRTMRRIQADLGDIYRERELWPQALHAYQLALEAGVAGISLRTATELISGVACILVAWNRLEQAAQFFGADAELRSRMSLAMRLHNEGTLVGHAYETARRGLGPPAFAAAIAAGQARSLDDVVTAIRALTPPSPRATAPRPTWRGLTARQVEITRLVAASCTDAEIAEALFLSTRTVGWHVSNILTHLGVASRYDLATLARDEGITDQREAPPPVP